MEKLLAYINALDPADRDGFAVRCDTTDRYLRKAVSAKQLLRPKLCVAIEHETCGLITRQELRPDWAEIWPELASAA